MPDVSTTDGKVAGVVTDGDVTPPETSPVGTPVTPEVDVAAEESPPAVGPCPTPALIVTAGAEVGSPPPDVPLRLDAIEMVALADDTLVFETVAILEEWVAVLE